MSYSFQVSPRLIRPTVLLSTLKILAICAALWPNESLCFISRTSSLDSLDIPLCSPQKVTPRPFTFMSCMLSSWEPFNKCAGFTHLGLSQVCITSNPQMLLRGSAITKDTLCAETGLLNPLTRNFPYSKGAYPPIAAFQFQQSDSPRISTFFQNLAASFSVKTIDGTTGSEVDEASITDRIFRHSLARVKRGVRFFFL